MKTKEILFHPAAATERLMISYDREPAALS